MKKITPIKRTKLSEEVYQRLLHMMRDGIFSPGQKLPPESELCTMLGVSRTALREGIKSLSGMKLLNIQHGKGIFVDKNPDILVQEDVLSTILERESFENMIEVRAAIDIGIARYAALKADGDDLESMNKGILLMEQAIAADPPLWEIFHEGDTHFHYALCKATHNPIFKKVGWPLVKYTIERGWKNMEGKYEKYNFAAKDHKDILEAVKRKDVQGSIDRMMKHLDNAFGLELRHQTKPR